MLVSAQDIRDPAPMLAPSNADNALVTCGDLPHKKKRCQPTIMGIEVEPVHVQEPTVLMCLAIQKIRGCLFSADICPLKCFL